MLEIRCVVDAKNKLGEAPMWCPVENALYWVDIENKLLQRFQPANGKVDRWTMPERIASFALCEGGGLIVALASGIAFYDLATGALDWIAKPEAHLPGNRFNDGKCDRKGRFWAGTMDDSLTDATAALYRIDGDLSVHKMADGIGISNSLAWSPQNDRMYFADTLIRSIYVFDYDHKTGDIDNRRILAKTAPGDGSPDGSTIDADGYLWNASWDGWKLVRYTPDGTVDRLIDLPVQKPTSCMFGGPDLRTLYITSAVWDLTPEQLERQPWAGGLLSVDVGVAGVLEPRFRRTDRASTVPAPTR